MAESTEYFGADRTSGPLRLVFQAIFGHVSDVHWDFIHKVIRKSGHFFGYGFIGLAWLRAWRMTLPQAHFLSDTVFALLGTALIASLDEYHQTFLPNRNGSPWDVLLDCCGALTLQLLAYIFLRLTRNYKLVRVA
jgi:VanZ family protein